MYKLVNPTRPMHHLNEITQSLNVRFSFAKVDGDNVHRLHEWVKCRDFLGDVVYAMTQKAVSDIYGFCVKPDVWQWEEQKTILIIQFPTVVSRDAFMANYEHIVHPVEKANKLSLSKVSKTDNELVVVVEGHKYWQRTVWLISLYSFLLKCSCYPYKNVVEWRKEIVEKGVTESSYAMKTQANWDKVIGNLKKITGRIKHFCGSNTDDICKIHNHHGFVAILGLPKIQPNNLYCANVLKLL